MSLAGHLHDRAILLQAKEQAGLEFLIDFLFLTTIYFIFFYDKWIKKSKLDFTIRTIMYVYVVMVFSVTLMPFATSFGGRNDLFMESANFIPFRDLLLQYGNAKKEIILNVLMMIPFGFLYPLLTHNGMRKTITRTFLFSFTIESCQLLTVWWASPYERSFDVTDLITNTSGGFIGYLLFITITPLGKRFRSIHNHHTPLHEDQKRKIK